MEILNTSLQDLSKEKSIRSDTKFHIFYTNRIKTERERYLTITKLVDIKHPKIDISSIDINGIWYVEISNTSKEGEITPVQLNNLKDLSEFKRLTVNDKLKVDQFRMK